MRRSLLLLLFVAFTLTAVEVGPVPVLKVIDGDTIEVQLDGKPERVRLLYVDTPESGDNEHGKAMEEGKKAAEALSSLLPVGTSVMLCSSGRALASDRYGRLLALIVRFDDVPTNTDAAAPTTINSMMILAGWTPFWRKYGEPNAPLASELSTMQTEAERVKAGAWATAPDWMLDKANERTAPKE